MAKNEWGKINIFHLFNGEVGGSKKLQNLIFFPNKIKGRFKIWPKMNEEKLIFFICLTFSVPGNWSFSYDLGYFRKGGVLLPGKCRQDPSANWTMETFSTDTLSHNWYVEVIQIWDVRVNQMCKMQQFSQKDHFFWEFSRYDVGAAYIVPSD